MGQEKGETTYVMLAGDCGPMTRTSYIPTEDERNDFQACAWRYRIHYRYRTTTSKADGWSEMGYPTQMKDEYLASFVEIHEQWLSETPSAGGERLIAGSVEVVRYEAIA
ncbi:hypothetical protein [Micromonospora sp. NPDC047730]|uniref:hypothetical protein n=1 Tax=Micromonospora sp. NPDC047730 TaxID=3364253 RepID=UPI003715DDC1